MTISQQESRPQHQARSSKLKGALWLVAINSAVLLVLIILCELVLGHWLDIQERVYCYDEVLHHAYCPGISITRRLSAEDGGAVVENYIDMSRVRVASRDLVNNSTDWSRYEVINIGDSFVEADEIPYEQTIGRVMSAATGKSVLDFGYASWAPIIYLNWIQLQKLREGVRINIFLMVNDVTPDGGTTAIGYRKSAVSVKDGRYKFYAPVEDKSLRGILSQNSFFYSKLPLIQRAIYLAKVYIKFTVLRRDRPPQPAQPPAQLPAQQPVAVNQPPAKNLGDAIPWLDVDLSKPQTDCGILEKYHQQLPPAEGQYFTFDYLSFAFAPQCWTADQHAEVKATVEDINRIEEIVGKVHGTVRIYVVPPGWSFPGENLIGKATPYYRMREGTVITTLPLGEQLRSLLPNVPVVSLEPVIAKLKTEHPGQFYFPSDGHWTPLAHKYLGAWLASELRQ